MNSIESTKKLTVGVIGGELNQYPLEENATIQDAINTYLLDTGLSASDLMSYELRHDGELVSDRGVVATGAVTFAKITKSSIEIGSMLYEFIVILRNTRKCSTDIDKLVSN